VNTLKREWAAVKILALVFLRIAASPLVLRTALFFLLFLTILLTLVFEVGFPKRLLWQLIPLSLIFSAALAFRTLWNRIRSVTIQGPTVYDKAEYHYDGDFPKGLARKQAFVHTGMFVGWLIEHDMIAKDFLEEAQKFKAREISGAQVYKAWDGCLNSDMLVEEGRRFASDYFDFEHGQFLDDYEALLVKDLPSLYHVADTWENYNLIKTKIDERYEAWKRKQR
jgi:PII-like signaling protein